MGRVTRRKTYKTQTPETVKNVYNSPQQNKTPHKSRHDKTQTPDKHRKGACSSRDSRHRTPVRPRHGQVRTCVMAYSQSPCVDDGFPLSQAPGEVGWDASAQYPVGNSKMRISDIMKNFHRENQKKESVLLEAIPGTPPPLDLWRAESPLSQGEPLPEPVRPTRKQQARTRRSKMAVTSMAMLSKLQSVLSNLKAQEEKEESSAGAESEDRELLLRRSERLSQQTKSEAESNSDVSSARSNSLDRSTDLFEAHPIANEPTKASTDRQVLVPCSTPKRVSGNQSYDELWTDEAFDDSFMRLTQAFEQGNGFVTPRAAAQKRKNCLTTPEGAHARKTGRFVVGSEAKADESVLAVVPCASTPKRGGFEECAGFSSKLRGINKVPEPASCSNSTGITAEKSSTKCDNAKPVRIDDSARSQHHYGTRNTINPTKSAPIIAQHQFIHPETAPAVTSNRAATNSTKASLPFQGYSNNKVNSAISTRTMSSTQATSEHQNNPPGPARPHQGVRPQFLRHHSMPVSGKVAELKPISPIISAPPDVKVTQPSNPQSTTGPVMTRNRVGVHAATSSVLKPGKGAMSPPLSSGPRPSGTQLSPHNQLGNLSMIGSCSQFGAQVLATSTQVSVHRVKPGRQPLITGPQIKKLPKFTSAKPQSPKPAFKIPSKPERKASSTVGGTSAGATVRAHQSVPPVRTDTGSYELLLDMSISDDVLASLAEPDDLLDSQQCMELFKSPTQTKNAISSQASTVTFDDTKLQGDKSKIDWSDGDWGHLDNLMLDKTNIKSVPRRTKSVTPTPKVVGLDEDEDDGLFDDDVMNMIEEVELRASQEKHKESVRPSTRSSALVQASELAQQSSVLSSTTVPVKSLPVDTLPPVSVPTASKKTGLFKFKSSSHIQKSQHPATNSIIMPAQPNNSGDLSKLDKMVSRSLDVGSRTSACDTLLQHSRTNRVGARQENNIPAIKTVQTNQVPVPSHASSLTGQSNKCGSVPTVVSNRPPKSGNLPLTKATGVTVGTRGVTSLTAAFCPIRPAKVEEATISGSSSGSSTVTNSPVKCSMEEIQKKRLEAMKKRENRLKLSKSGPLSICK